MGKRSWKMENVKSACLGEGDAAVVGLDTHKESVHAAVRVNGEERGTWVMAMDPKTIVKSLMPIKGHLKRVVYEAGPTGYGLARALKKAGLPVAVVAPGKVPQEANPASKSDRLDCRKLAEYAENKTLKVVAIPSEEEEADRQVLRLRDQLMKKQRRVKQQIRSLLLEYGVPEPEGLDDWSAKAVKALRPMRLRHQLQLSLEVLLEELDHIVALRERVERHLQWLMRQTRHRQDHRIVDSHPGVGPLTATAFCLEVYQPERFATPAQLAHYVGLAPRVRQSGLKRQEGPLIPAGRGPLRALLIEASWAWIRKDTAARAVYGRILHNTGKSQKAIVAMARRMAVHLWTMRCRRQEYRPVA